MNRRSPRPLLEFLRRPAEELRQRRAIEVMAHLEVRVRRRARELIPRAHELTVIAADDAVADGSSQRDRDRTVMLDGEVGDAAPRIELVRRDDGARRAGRDARLARAAVRARRRIERECEISEDLAEKE